MMGETPLGELIAVYECNCGTKFSSQESMRTHAQQCEAMPHVGGDDDA
jgi:hypothetical protein